MKKYLIDSDILIYFLKGKQEVVQRLSQIPIDDLYISRINYTELIYGAYNSSKINQNLKIIEPFLDSFKVLEFTQVSSLIFAKEKARLKKNGNIIADMDLMIASIAIENDCILISNNIKHFDRVQNLKLEPKLEEIKDKQ
jgi:predicted nucleic acid-binding protein